MKSLKYALALATSALSLLAAKSAMATESASATITSSQINSATWNYSLTLKNTGTTGIGTFWFAWVPGQSYMTANPSNVLAPGGWENGPDSQLVGGFEKGASIEFQSTVTASDLAAGGTLSGFSFNSTEAPAAMFGSEPFFNSGNPTTTAFIYGGAPFSDGGFKFAATAVPEPGTLAVVGIGAVAVLGISARRRRRAAAV